jgi:hypothetical protein
MSLCPVTDGTKPEAGNAVVVAPMESSNGLCQQYTSSMFQVNITSYCYYREKNLIYAIIHNILLRTTMTHS